MKYRLFAILLALCLVFSLVACSSEKSGVQEPSSQESAEGTNEPAATEHEAAEPAQAAERGEEDAQGGAVSESTLNYYGLTEAEFTALHDTIRDYIDREWDAQEVYLDDLDVLYDLVSAIRIDMSEDFMKNETVDAYIDSECGGDPHFSDLSILRLKILIHAFNEWAAQQQIDYDAYYSAWESLNGGIFAAVRTMDTGKIAPLFDLESE